MDEGSDRTDVDRKAKKKAKKVESAWISFFGRILAQLVGAAATVGLGIALVRSQMGVPASTPPAPIVSATPARALGQQRSVEEVFALLDANRDGRLTQAEVPAEMWSRMLKADSNGDLTITPAELHAARARAKAPNDPDH